MKDLPADLAEFLSPRVERLGYLGEFFKCGANRPDALLAFQKFTEESKKGLPKKLVEVVALTAAVQMGNAYERNQHERLCIRSGYSRGWVEAVECCQPDDFECMSAEEKNVQEYVLAAIDRRGNRVDFELDALVASVGPEVAVGIMMVLGRYVTHAIIVNSLDLVPPVPSIFEDDFTI